jgi:hypothetical protein
MCWAGHAACVGEKKIIQNYTLKPEQKRDLCSYQETNIILK